MEVDDSVLEDFIHFFKKSDLTVSLCTTVTTTKQIVFWEKLKGGEKMSLDQLTDPDVINLINTFKQFIKDPIKLPPLVGSTKDDAYVEDSVNGIRYVMHYYRGNIENKYSIHLRFTDNNIHLVRLCINGGRHYNADGTFADGNHIHLYHFIKGLGEVEAHVYPLTSTPFGDPQSLIEDLEKFIAYVHVKNN